MGWKATGKIQVRAHVGMNSGGGHGVMRSGWVERYLGGELTDPTREGLEAVSEALCWRLCQRRNRCW